MGPGFVGGKLQQGGHAVSFLLGAALPTALLFFLASDRLGEGLSTISTSWRGNGTTTASLQADAPPADIPTAADGRAAPAQDHEVEFAGLAELLTKVATEDRTVIMTSVTEVWTRPNSLLDVFLGGFRDGEGIAHLVSHVLIVTVDAGSFRGCKAVHPHCYLLEVKSMDMNMAKTFGTREYVEMIWLKLSIQQRVLELGYNFLFTDADILWLRNPFQHISVYADMSCSLDNSKMAPALLDCENNVGFYYMKSTNRSIAMIKYWRAARARFDGNPIEQVVFNTIKHELISDLGARIQPLQTEYISGFCDFQERLDKVCTVHANCCMRLDNKVNDLRNVAADWKNYTSLTPEVRKKAGIKVTPPSKCRKSMGWT
ncbi:uncharacterized protein At1g28695-like [Panicum virgatum]|uniref:Nucleotide-diphospho-sugar transferase domain-containing protein n=1 Tax=Panicum virgatum TaxID=38727 RepID=A0A8T0T3N1_PANVG|nr:uncharacterized protein At1g28695-like [Panicum virgatum]KAG2602976.1 hypothetical protein PVAP13_5KG734400 [Panicum virgatum]